MIIVNSYDEVLAALLDGAVGVMPTDTVYGVVCRAQDQMAAKRLYALKSREHKPGPVIAASISQLKDLGAPADQLSLAAQYWPGPVSVILRHDRAYLHQGRGDQPFRIPDDEALRALLERTGPLLTTSANQPGQPPAATLDEARHYFGDQVDFYVDIGSLTSRPPSTIIRFSDAGKVEIVRQGAVRIKL